ncbi:AAA family ATPase [Rhizobium rhizogenes]|uniref:AAA family ATPase n=1 Tax=Rhizobium rhizogenes TaxID=359 RepID=UPI0015743526|nr:AAA family ATPase [Rhizobium rhizogenes]NTH22975.1 AAA family ATPase [Rhizobium rhizogenes]NTH36005.1 AAA family ATPase [Rhizobium rhizogenes]
MILHLNGWPGVGKYTVGKIVAKGMGARFLDNHTVLNIAIALTDRGTPAYYELATKTRDMAFEAILNLASSEPVVMTGVVASGGSHDFLIDNWKAILSLAERRECGVYSVVLTCSEEENVRRMNSEDREAHRKKRKPELLAELLRTRKLFNEGAAASVEIDNTNLLPEACADKIISWLWEVTALKAV